MRCRNEGFCIEACRIDGLRLMIPIVPPRENPSGGEREREEDEGERGGGGWVEKARLNDSNHACILNHSVLIPMR